MSKPVATEVRVSAHGVVVIGRRPTVTSVYFRPNGVTRLEELVLRFAPTPQTPAALLPDGRLLVVGRSGESLLVSAGRTPQPGPTCPVPPTGLSGEGVVFAPGPRLLRFVAGAWVDESPALEGPPVELAAVAQFAVGAGGSIWAPGKGRWSKQKSPTAAALGCASGAWVGGVGVTVERDGKKLVAHAVKGTVTAIAPWKDSALLLVDGRLVDLKGRVLKTPGTVSSISAHGEAFWCVANGSVFESTDLKRFRRQVLPS
jgi:hypothetical protein